MEIKTKLIFNRKAKQVVHGVSIKPDGGTYYCKYPIGHQNYKTEEEAKEAADKITDAISNGGKFDPQHGESKGIDAREWVEVKDKLMNRI